MKMNGKVVLVTGGTNGIGLETARQLAEMGAKVAIVGRNPEKTAHVVEELKRDTQNPNIESFIADLSLMSDVRKLAAEVEARYDRLDVLVNNAGGYFQQRQLTAEGLEMTFALNHLNYFLLTNLLLPLLKDSAPARVINVSSGAHMTIRELDFDNLQGETSYSGIGAYGRSKLENILFTYELARRVEKDGITVNALHPGLVATGFGHNNGGIIAFLTKLMQRVAGKSAEDGAKTPVYLASSPEVANVTGKYFDNGKAVKSSSASYNEADWVKLWDVSAELSGLKESETASA